MRAHDYGNDEEASCFPKKQAWLKHEGVTGVISKVAVCIEVLGRALSMVTVASKEGVRSGEAAAAKRR